MTFAWEVDLFLAMDEARLRGDGQAESMLRTVFGGAAADTTNEDGTPPAIGPLSSAWRAIARRATAGPILSSHNEGWATGRGR